MERVNTLLVGLSRLSEFFNDCIHLLAGYIDRTTDRFQRIEDEQRRLEEVVRRLEEGQRRLEQRIGVEIKQEEHDDRQG